MEIVGSLQTIVLSISSSISGLDEEVETYTPPNGALVRIKSFNAEGFFDKTSFCEVIWKYDHSSESEEIKWLTYGSSNSTIPVEVSGADGVRQLAIKCTNGTLVNRRMSISVLIEVVEQ